MSYRNSIKQSVILTAAIINKHIYFYFFVLSTVASGLNALAAVTVEDFAPLVVQRIPTEREALVSKLLGNECMPQL